MHQSFLFSCIYVLLYGQGNTNGRELTHTHEQTFHYFHNFFRASITISEDVYYCEVNTCTDARGSDVKIHMPDFSILHYLT